MRSTAAKSTGSRASGAAAGTAKRPGTSEAPKRAPVRRGRVRAARRGGGGGARAR